MPRSTEPRKRCFVVEVELGDLWTAEDIQHVLVGFKLDVLATTRARTVAELARQRQQFERAITVTELSIRGGRTRTMWQRFRRHISKRPSGGLFR